MIKRRFSTPSMKAALGSLPESQRQKIQASNTHAQKFKNFLRATVGSGSIPERKLRLVSRAAANAVVGRIIKRATISPNEIPATYELSTRLPKQRSIVFQNGARAQIRTAYGGPIHGFNSLGKAIQIMVDPRKLEPAVQTMLTTKQKTETSPELKGALGSLGIIFKTNQTTPAIQILNIQTHNLHNLPKRLQQEYSNWHIEAIHFIEEEAKKLGIPKISLVDNNPTPQNSNPVLPRLIQEGWTLDTTQTRQGEQITVQKIYTKKLE